MNATSRTHVPVSGYPDDIQQRVLEFLNPADLCRMQLVSKTEKSVVDKFLPLFQKKELRKEGFEVRERIEGFLATAQANYTILCNRNQEEGGPSQEYDKILSIFNRFKANCERFLPELPSVREDSYGLFYSIHAQHPRYQRTTRENFNSTCLERYGINDNSFELVTKKTENYFNGDTIARIYNLTIMSEFIEKSLEEIEKKQTT